jgi:Transducer of regulated CREB activity middle domain
MLSPRAHKRLSSSQSNSMKNLHQQQQHSPTMSQQHSHSQQNMPQSTFEQQTLMQQHQQAINQHHLMNNLQDMKSRSVSRLPGIKLENFFNRFTRLNVNIFFFFFSVYPSQNEDTLQIPVGNSTGSLPDLTLVHYQQSPLSTPLDLEHDQLAAVTSSSFNTVRSKN